MGFQNFMDLLPQGAHWALSANSAANFAMPFHMAGVIAPCRSCTASSSHQHLVHTGVAKQQAVPRSSRSAISSWSTQGGHVFQAFALTGLAVLASQRKRLQRLRALQRQAVAE